MDGRGHGQSEGLPWLIETVEMCADDHCGFHEKVLHELYPDVSNRPPTFLLSQSWGGMQMLNAMLRGYTDYTAVVWLAPYWCLYDFPSKWLYWWYSNYQLMVSSGRPLCPVITINHEDHAPHTYHWRFDAANRVQQRTYYAETILNQFNQILDFKKLPETIGSFFPPSMLYIGGKEDVIDNEAAKEIFNKMDTKKKLLFDPEMDHMPHKDGLKIQGVVQQICSWYEENSPAKI